MNRDNVHHNGSIAEGDVESQALEENKRGNQRNDTNMGKNSSHQFFPPFKQHFEDPGERVLRSCDKDLELTIGSDNNKQFRWYHSAIIASHSGVIDTMLLSPTKEGQTIEINLPDITVEKWDLMLKYLEDPVEARRMTVKDLKFVAKGYNKYDIEKGRELCSQVLAEYFKKTMQKECELMKQPGPLDNATTLSDVVDAMVLTHEANIDGVGKKEGMKYLRRRLKQTRSKYNGNLFTEDHMRRLVPVLLAENNPGIGWRKEKINSPDFPHLFVNKNTLVPDRKNLKCLAILTALVVACSVFLFGGFVQ